MTTYISTGGFSKFSADKISEKLISTGINSIELSGGIYSTNVIDNLYELKEKANFQIHNYFPPPKIPFVLNLASQDTEISNLSLESLEKLVRIRPETLAQASIIDGVRQSDITTLSFYLHKKQK